MELETAEDRFGATRFMASNILQPLSRSDGIRGSDLTASPPKRGFNCQEAMAYLGIKRKAFDRHIRPRVEPIRIGNCLVFERFDLDRAFDDYRAERNGRPGKKGGVEWA